MRPQSWIVALFSSSLALARHPHLAKRIPSLLDPVCARIANELSSGGLVCDAAVSALQYQADIYHWASSSSQLSKCSVQPRTAQEVAKVLRILAETRTPFAVKGGGHTTNAGFSSTTGVHIAMSQFRDVDYDAGSQTAVIGAGLIWDDVYAALAPHGVNVLGGRVTGVGVAGYTLGGGYSWKSNQYGLAVDSVVAFELVKPDGTVAEVTAGSDLDLFVGLKGGLNNFGIVTRFTMKTYPQTLVWGGLITFGSAYIPDVLTAVAEFSAQVTDPKASIITTSGFLLGQPEISQVLFYDAPTPPAGIFDAFLAIPYITKDVGTRDFLSLVKVTPSDATSGQRGLFHTVSLTQYTPTLLNAILNETIFWGERLGPKSAAFISYSIEPFLPSLFSHGTSPSAYPPDRSTGLSPFNIYYAWAAQPFDADFYDAAQQSAAHIELVAEAEGQRAAGAPLYPNYAAVGTPLARMYGGGVPGLRALRRRVDPDDVMGLAGGFRF